MLRVLLVPLLFALSCYGQMELTNLGCWRDTGSRAISTVEGSSSLLDGRYQARINALNKCARVAKLRGYSVFALQHGGWCATSPIAGETYTKYGRSTACAADGEGGPWANQVYKIDSVNPTFTSLGCWKDTSDRAIPTAEGTSGFLKGDYRARKDAVNMCARVAKQRGHNVFALQNGGWCATSNNAKQTYKKHGKSTACATDGEGGPWANQVYEFVEDQRKFRYGLACEHSKNVQISCPTGMVISVHDAYYGRNGKNKCPSDHILTTSCKAEGSPEKIKNICQHKRSCVLEPKNSLFGDPCQGTLKYIEVRYLCIPAITVGLTKLGCWRDTGNRAIPTAEGSSSLLDGKYQARRNALNKCARVAKQRGNNIFALQHGGWCATSSIAGETYTKYGKSTACAADGEGGPWANQVYKIDSVNPTFTSLGCWKDTSDRAIPTAEGTSGILKGNYRARKDAINKCASVAKQRGHNVFALQNGGWCATSNNAKQTYKKHGKSTACATDGEGGPWANQVYEFVEDQRKFRYGLACEHSENVQISCPTGMVISVYDAYYGRNDKNKCSSDHILTTSCKAEGSPEKIKNICQHKKSCVLEPKNSIFGDPCQGTLKYIEVRYLCIPAITVGLTNLGCWRDTGNRAIPAAEGTSSLLDGNYRSRRNALNKCARVAKQRGNNIFALQHGGWCATSSIAGETYTKYGKSTACAADGEGGPWANQVYKIESVYAKFSNLGCWKDTGNRAIPTAESTSGLLDGNYRARKDALSKCARVAKQRRHSVFALQNGGWCATSRNAYKTYQRYGKSTACATDGEGGPWANQVYQLREVVTPIEYALACEHSNDVKVTCPEGMIIVVHDAFYGRTNANKCPSDSILTTSCKAAGSLGQIKKACHKKNSCVLEPKNSVFGDPCYGTAKYIQMNYQCVYGSLN